MKRLATYSISVPFVLMLALVARIHAQASAELPSTKQEVSNALVDLRDRYGLDAVKLESFLLQYAIRAGATLTTSVTMRGVEEFDGHSYLDVDFDSGLIYGPPDVSPAQAPAKIWSDIVDPTLRQFRSMQLAADGIVLRVRFRHSKDDTRQILREGAQDAVPLDVISFGALHRQDELRETIANAPRILVRGLRRKVSHHLLLHDAEAPGGDLFRLDDQTDGRYQQQDQHTSAAEESHLAATPSGGRGLGLKRLLRTDRVVHSVSAVAAARQG